MVEKHTNSVYVSELYVYKLNETNLNAAYTNTMAKVLAYLEHSKNVIIIPCIP